MISVVQDNGEAEVQGTTVVHRSGWFTYCNPEYRFVVVVDTRSFDHPALRGVITAYKKVRT